MLRYWVIAPIEAKRADLFDRVWRFDFENGLISIGWTEVGDVSHVNREELAQIVAMKYRDKPLATQTLFANMLWTFYHQISPGDIVVARRGRKVLAAVGRVTETATYSPGKNALTNHPNFLGVAWQDQPRDKTFSTLVFAMLTLAELTEEQFRSLTGRTEVASPTESLEDVEDENEFVLEKYLEEFIVSNFQSIFKGELKIYEDSDGIDGQQYATETGPIDILAYDSKGKSFVVIELKKGRSSDQVVGQVLRYMGWVKKNLCVDDQSVRGLVICRDSDPKLSYALDMTAGIDLKYYKVSFELSKSVPRV